jgi:hypothetical protein
MEIALPKDKESWQSEKQGPRKISHSRKGKCAVLRQPRVGTALGMSTTPWTVESTEHLSSNFLTLNPGFYTHCATKQVQDKDKDILSHEMSQNVPQWTHEN